MATRAQLELAITVRDVKDNLRQSGDARAAWLPAAALLNGKREIVSLTLSAFTTLSPPTGAKVLVVEFDREPNAVLINLTLKGVTGDTGIKLVPASAPSGIPLVLPLGASPSIGIANAEASTQTIELLWL